MKYGYIIIVALAVFLGYSIYNTVKVADKIISKRAEQINSALIGR